MAEYRFRLETLRRLRLAHRDILCDALADAYRAEEVLTEQRSALAAERAEVQEIQRKAMSEEHLDVNRLIAAQRYEMILQANERQLTEQSAQVAVETDRRRTALVEADRAIRLLDLLDQKKQQQYRRVQQQLAIKELDEIASVMRPVE